MTPSPIRFGLYQLTPAASLIILVIVVLRAGAASAADFLAADLSNNVVKVSSNFTGTEVILFGAFLQTKGRSFGPISGSDVIVVVRGPPERVTVRRKERFGVIWMNMNAVTFTSAPSFYFVASTIPLDALDSESFLNEHQIGLKHIAFESTSSIAPNQLVPFRDALIEKRERYSEAFTGQIPLYTQIVDAPTCRSNPTDGCFFRFSNSALFNAHLPIPANIPIGKLEISLYFVRDGRPVPNVVRTWVLDVSRSGIDGWLYKHAVANPILYGLGAILLAVTAGLTATLIARKA